VGEPLIAFTRVSAMTCSAAWWPPPRRAPAVWLIGIMLRTAGREQSVTVRLGLWAHPGCVVTHRDRLTALGDIEPLDSAARPGGHRGPVDWAIGQWRWLVPVTVTAAAFAWVVGVVAGRAQGAERFALIVSGAALTAAAAGVPLWQQHRASAARADAVAAARAARAAMRIALEDALDPFVHLVSRLAEARGSDKARLRGAAIQLAVATVAALAGVERVRVCFFVLDEGPPRRLQAERFAGRAGAPDVVFVEGTSAGDAALRMLRRGTWNYVADLAEEPRRFWWDADRRYRTFLAGPVATPEKVIGLLTLDALRPGELAHVDLTLVRLLTDLLALAISL
jgi:GAF domain